MFLRKHPSIAKTPRKLLKNKSSLAVRFRNINILLFVLAFCIITAVMAAVFNDVIRGLSSGYAVRNAATSAEVLSARIVKELGLLAKAARSSAVREWMADEGDDDKKALAYNEMAGIVGELYSSNLYVGLEGSLHEYKIEEGYAAEHFQPFTTLDRNNPMDAWYFECIAADNDYVLGVGIDNVMQRKRVWLNYMVTQNGVPLGVICTGLEFSHIVGELFSNYDDNNMRGFIIDENGIIHMDSSLIDSEAFLYHDFETHIDTELPDPDALATIWTHLSGMNGYPEETGEPMVIELSSGSYRYMTITSIQFTNWAVVILSGTPSLFDISLFFPVAIIVLVLLVAFALITNTANYRLIFLPLGKMSHSLAIFKENHEGSIYGVERNDELGELSKTIQDLFTKANVDALTGIYNRRFMENNLQHAMEFLARANGLLSVLMLDIDYFKKYNDTYGHDQGDVCLKQVAKALASSITRPNDFVARYGGEEFLAVLPNTDEAGARVVAEKLLESVQGLNILHAKNDAAPYVTVSIGVTTGKVAYMQSMEDYVRRADEGLYMSKQNGRNQYTYLSFPDRLIH